MGNFLLFKIYKSILIECIINNDYAVIEYAPSQINLNKAIEFFITKILLNF